MAVSDEIQRGKCVQHDGKNGNNHTADPKCRGSEEQAQEETLSKSNFHFSHEDARIKFVLG